ncbi:Homeobox domain containing protein [Aphelenchoides avenae]|nr:Homeobox domain containing protein [Aphelenchus avenae]
MSQRVRTVLTEQQLEILKQMYGNNQRPDAMTEEQVVEMTGLSSRVIRVWFENKRCKDKKRQVAMREQQQNQEKVTLGQRFEEQAKHVCTLIAPCVRTAGYLLVALLGSIILVLAVVSPIIVPCASFILAHLASPGYNSTWDWTARELEVRIQGALAYVIMALCLCVWVNQAYMLLMNFWILFRCGLLKATSQPQSSSALRADLIKQALISHFRRIFQLFLFHLMTVLVVYPLVVLGVPCLTGIMFAQMCAYIPLEFFNLFLRGRYRVIMRLSESEVSTATVDKTELTRRFNEAGLPGIE